MPWSDEIYSNFWLVYLWFLFWYSFSGSSQRGYIVRDRGVEIYAAARVVWSPRSVLATWSVSLLVYVRRPHLDHTSVPRSPPSFLSPPRKKAIRKASLRRKKADLRRIIAQIHLGTVWNLFWTSLTNVIFSWPWSICHQFDRCTLYCQFKTVYWGYYCLEQEIKSLEFNLKSHTPSTSHRLQMW
jgi:hypothetical protein